MATSSGSSTTQNPTTQNEIERKYDVEETTVMPGFDGLDAAGVSSARSLGEFHLEAEYFDTAGQDLAAHRITLRRRSGGTDDGWHLKLPADVGRTELHLPLNTAASDDRSAVPAPVLDPVRAIVRDRPLALIARIDTRRAITRLYGTDDAELVEIADDTVTASDASTGAVRIWREWEAELLDGAPTEPDAGSELLDTVEERLRSAGARPASSASKLASALGRTTLGTTAAAPFVDAESAASEVLLVAVRALVEDIVAQDLLVRQDQPDSVHQLRTRLRRLRSLFATYRTVLDRSSTDVLRRSLQELGTVLGAARDAEVMRDRASALVDDHVGIPRAVGDTLAHSWDEEHSRALDAVHAELSSERYYRVLDALDDFVARPALAEQAFSAASDVLRSALAADLRRVITRAKRADAAGSELERIPLLHETRKAAKRLRYAAEAVSDGPSGVLGERVRRVADAAESVHDLLGEHRDSVLLQNHLRATATVSGHPFEYGVLHELERHSAALCLEDYRGALTRLRRQRRKL